MDTHDTLHRNKSWSYHEAFIRNRGLINAKEQERLRSARIAIVGMGGVGGVHLATLARLGIGNFTIADPDVFDVANINRQYGALQSTLGRPKAQVMAEITRDINPEANVRVMTEPISEHNVDELLQDADLVVDGIDIFAMAARRTVFSRAAAHNIPAVTAGPLGFSTAWLVFSPTGMTFDRYFDITDATSELDMFIAFVVGLAPRATHRTYLDMSFVDVKNETGPSTTVACQLAAGVVGTTAIKILLGRGSVAAAPQYQQFDAYHNRFAQGVLRSGNRHPVQKFKRWWLKRYARQHGLVPNDE